MTHRTQLLAVLLLGLLAPVSAAQQRPRQLVEQLGSGLFDKRERAEKALLALGIEALPALREAVARRKDAEVVLRARRTYWRILVPEALAKKLREPRKALIEQAQGKGAKRKRAIRSMLYYGGQAALALAVELAQTGEGQVVVAASRRLLAALDRPSRKVLILKLLPTLTKHPKQVESFHLELLLLHDAPAVIRLRVALALSPDVTQQRKSRAIEGLVERGSKACWQALLSLSRRPGTHRFAIAQRYSWSIRKTWPKTAPQLLPGLQAELELQARRPRPQRHVELLIDGLKKAYARRWNAQLMRLFESKQCSKRMRLRLLAFLSSRPPVPHPEQLIPFLAVGTDPGVLSSLAWYFDTNPLPKAMPALRLLYRERPRGNMDLTLTRSLARSNQPEDWALLEQGAAEVRGRAPLVLAGRAGGKGIAFLSELYLNRRAGLKASQRKTLERALISGPHARDQLPLSVLGLLVSNSWRPVSETAVRIVAARAGGPARKILMGLLGGDDGEFLRIAAVALCDSPGSEAAGKLLLERLSAIVPTRGGRLARYLIEALGDLRYRPAVPTIRGFQRHGSGVLPAVASGVLSLLGELGMSTQMLLAQVRKGTQPQRKEAIKQLRDRATPRIARALLDIPAVWSSDDNAARKLVERALGARVVLEVAERYLLGRLDGEHTRPWLEKLVQIHPRSQGPALRRLLRRFRGDPEHRRLVGKLLVALGDEAAIGRVLGWLRHPTQRQRAFRILQNNPDERAMWPLLKLLDLKRPVLSREVLPLLQGVLFFEAGSFQRIRGGSLESRIAWWTRWRSAHKPNSRRPEWLRRILLSGDLGERSRAVAAIRLLELRQLVPDLISQQLNERRYMRIKMIRTLGHLGGWRAIEALISLNRDKTPEVAATAAEALARLGDSAAQARLGLWLEGRIEAPGPDTITALARARLLAEQGYRVGYRALTVWSCGGGSLLKSGGRKALSELAGLALPQGFLESAEQADRTRQRIQRWWRANQQRFRLLVLPRTPASEVLLKELVSATSARRGEIVSLLVRSGRLDRAALIGLLLGGDLPLRDLVAELLRRRKAGWAGPFLQDALLGGQALPSSKTRKLELDKGKRVRQMAQTMGRMSGFSGFTGDTHLTLLLRDYRDPLTEALIALDGARAVGPLVRWGRQRSQCYRLYLLYRLRALFNKRIVTALAFKPERVVRRLARWVSWAERQSPGKPPAPIDKTLARYIALEAASPRALTSATSDAAPLVRQRALALLWRSLTPAEKAPWVARSGSSAWVREVLVSQFWQATTAFSTAKLPPALRSRLHAGLAARTRYARGAGESERIKALALVGKTLGIRDSVGWLKKRGEAARILKLQQAVATWTEHLKKKQDYQGYYGRGWSLLQLKRYREAIDDLTRARPLADSTSRKAYLLFGLGFAHEKLGQLAKAAKDFQAWEALGYAHQQARHYRIRIAWKMQKPREVLELTKTQRMPRDALRGLPYRACALVRLKQLTEANKILIQLKLHYQMLRRQPKRAKLLAKEGAQAVFDLGWALYHAATGWKQKAIDRLEKAIRGGAIDKKAAAGLPEFKRWSQTPEFKKLLGG